MNKQKTSSIGYFMIAFVFLIYITQSVTLPPFLSAADLPYQAHSFNDVDYIRQLLQRGVKYFKIDVSMANRQSCAKNSNWNSSMPCYKTSQYAQQYCCLALKGDTSGRNNFDFKFNTIDNFIDMLQQYLSKKAVSKILLFAVNHQFDFQFDNQISENSIFKLAKLMEKYPKLYFGFGSDDFILQYDRICRNSIQIISINNQQQQQEQQPLKKLNAQACTQQRKFISLSKVFLQSGSDNPADPRDYYSRYRNFNVFYESVISRCNTGFPSWIKKHPEFPLIFWEPSNERQIQLVLQTFMSQKCRLLHGRDLSGLAITSNIDPQVFEFYLKKVNQSISQQKISFFPNNQKVALQYGSNFLAKVLMNNVNYLILGEQDSSLNPKDGSNLQLIQLKSDQTGLYVSQTQRSQQQKSKGTLKVVGGYNNLAIVQKSLDSSSQQVIFQITLINASNLTKISSTSIPSFVDLVNYRGIYYILRRTSNPTVFNIIKTPDFDSSSIIMSFSIALQKAKSIQSFIVFQDQNSSLRYLISGSFNGNSWVGQVRGQSIYKSGNIGFGINSKLILKQSGLLALSLQNGACNSAVLINNGDTPLCTYYKLDEFKQMVSTKSTITLIQFTYQHLISYLQSSQQVQPITPCTKNFVNYKVMNGKNVNVIDIWSRLFVVSEYVHISQQGLLNSLFSAGSNYDKLKNNRKGMLGTIWSRNNLGEINIKDKRSIIVDSEEVVYFE